MPPERGTSRLSKDPSNVRKARIRYEPFFEFISTRCTLGTEESVESFKLFLAYNSFRLEKGLPAANCRAVGWGIRHMNLRTGTTIKRCSMSLIDGPNSGFISKYHGIGLRSP